MSDTTTREAVVIEFMAGTMCTRQRQNISNPTCRSPIPAEALPEDEWCVSCIARSVVGDWHAARIQGEAR